MDDGGTQPCRIGLRIEFLKVCKSHSSTWHENKGCYYYTLPTGNSRLQPACCLPCPGMHGACVPPTALPPWCCSHHSLILEGLSPIKVLMSFKTLLKYHLLCEVFADLSCCNHALASFLLGGHQVTQKDSITFSFPIFILPKRLMGLHFCGLRCRNTLLKM